MRRFVLIAFVCVRAHAQTINPPVPAPTVPPAPATVPVPAEPYHPEMLIGLGAGGVFTAPVSGFGYQQLSGYLGAGTYATEATQYALSRGQVLTVELGGITKILYQFSNFTVFSTAWGGGAQGPTGNATAAAAVQPGIAYHFGKTNLSAALTVEKLWTQAGTPGDANKKQTAQVTIGLMYAVKK